jgi:hypothetical protein
MAALYHRKHDKVSPDEDLAMHNYVATIVGGKVCLRMNGMAALEQAVALDGWRNDREPHKPSAQPFPTASVKAMPNSPGSAIR